MSFLFNFFTETESHPVALLLKLISENCKQIKTIMPNRKKALIFIN